MPLPLCPVKARLPLKISLWNSCSEQIVFLKKTKKPPLCVHGYTSFTKLVPQWLHFLQLPHVVNMPTSKSQGFISFCIVLFFLFHAHWQMEYTSLVGISHWIGSRLHWQHPPTLPSLCRCPSWCSPGFPISQEQHFVEIRRLQWEEGGKNVPFSPIQTIVYHYIFSNAGHSWH